MKRMEQLFLTILTQNSMQHQKVLEKLPQLDFDLSSNDFKLFFTDQGV